MNLWPPSCFCWHRPVRLDHQSQALGSNGQACQKVNLVYPPNCPNQHQAYQVIARLRLALAISGFDPSAFAGGASNQKARPFSLVNRGRPACLLGQTARAANFATTDQVATAYRALRLSIRPCSSAQCHQASFANLRG